MYWRFWTKWTDSKLWDW